MIENESGTDAPRDDPDHVVTALLRHRGELLVCRRSDAVGTYPGAWGGVSGFAEGEPDEQVRVEIREETGLDAGDVTLVRTGRPFRIADREIGREWVVHPYLFDAASRDVQLSEEHTEAAWVAPTDLAIGNRETVPKLWETYQRVAPTVRSITADDEHGAAWLSVRAIEVLRDRAGLLILDREDGDVSGDDGGPTDQQAAVDEWDELAELARRLLESRPSMAVLRNRVNRVMGDAAAASDRPGADAVLEAAIAAIDYAVTADTAAAERASELANGRVLTLSRSGTVRDALRVGAPDRVLVAASQPTGEGIEVAEALSGSVPVTLVPDAAVAHALATVDVDAVLVGADTILPDGRVVNKAGTRAAALAAAREGVPVYVCAASEKVSTREAVNLESGDRTALYEGDAPIDVVNPTFDVTPADLVAGIVTERGTFDADEVGRVANELRENEGWDRTDDVE